MSTRIHTLNGSGVNSGWHVSLPVQIPSPALQLVDVIHRTSMCVTHCDYKYLGREVGWNIALPEVIRPPALKFGVVEGVDLASVPTLGCKVFQFHFWVRIMGHLIHRYNAMEIYNRKEHES